MDTHIDHLLWAVPDLDEASALFARTTGVSPASGGSHPGFGTRNRLVALGAGRYLEVIAPDPDQPLDGTLGAILAALPAPRMLTVALAGADLATLAQAATSAGAHPRAPVAMSRTRPDGVVLNWTILRFEDATRGAAMPFAIDWQDTPHPSDSTPGGCVLESLTMIDPDPAGLAGFFAAIGAEVEVVRGIRTGLIARLQTPNGTVVLT